MLFILPNKVRCFHSSVLNTYSDSFMFFCIPPPLQVKPHLSLGSQSELLSTKLNPWKDLQGSPSTWLDQKTALQHTSMKLEKKQFLTQPTLTSLNCYNHNLPISERTLCQPSIVTSRRSTIRTIVSQIVLGHRFQNSSVITRSQTLK